MPNKIKIAIIHFLPVEYYPPVKNMLECLTQKDSHHILLCSTTNHHGIQKWFASNSRIQTKRFGRTKPARTFLKRAIFNLRFIVYSYWALLTFKPRIIIYYASDSAIPVFFYSLLSIKKFRLAIHYHEYSSPSWYKKGPLISRIGHLIEKSYLYARTKYISHTNFNRLGKFYRDHPQLTQPFLCCLPNLPPPYWWEKPASKKTDAIIRIVYVGSLSLEDTWIEQLCKWVLTQADKLLLDIYCFNLTETADRFFTSLPIQNIRLFRRGTPYDNLPNILSAYDVGLILYKGTTENYRLNLPNKLFEYLACGLEVWFPPEMTLMNKWACPHSHPRVIPFNYQNPDTWVGFLIKEKSMPKKEALSYLKFYPRYIQQLCNGA